MSILQAADLYHTALIVDDLAAAMDRLARLAGHRWMTPVDYPVPVLTPSGEATVRLRMTYSLEPPLLELIEEVPGTPWAAVPGHPVHHIGYFVDDTPAASRGLTAAGLPLEVCARGADGGLGGFAYHRGADGLRVEVVSRTALDDMRKLAAALGGQR